MLKPDRADINWSDPAKLPPWARPVRLEPEGGDPEAPTQGQVAEKPAAKSIFERFDSLNKGN